MQQTFIDRVTGKNRQSKFDKALLRYLAGPDVPKHLIEHQLFKEVILAAKPALLTTTRKTLNS